MLRVFLEKSAKVKQAFCFMNQDSKWKELRENLLPVKLPELRFGSASRSGGMLLNRDGARFLKKRKKEKKYNKSIEAVH